MTQLALMRLPSSNRGFTLIELMITVAIVGILAAIAYPSYSQYVIRSNRAEGKALLMDAAAREERFFSNYNTYTDVEVGSSGCTGQACGLNYSSANSEHGFYALTATVGGGGTTYSLTAAVIAGSRQASDTQCGNLGLDSSNQKTEGGTGTVTDCW